MNDHPVLAGLAFLAACLAWAWAFWNMHEVLHVATAAMVR